MRIYEWIDRHHTLLSFMGSTELPGYYSRFLQLFIMDLMIPAMWICLDAEIVTGIIFINLLWNYLEADHGTTWKPLTELPRKSPWNYLETMWIYLEYFG